MDDKVKKLDTAEKCKIFAKNCIERGREDLAIQANQRAIQLKAEAYGATSDVEKEALEAIYAYEQVLSAKNRRNTRATRTWQMIDRRGIIDAVESAVKRPIETQGYTALAEMGLEDYSFESVIVRYPNFFSKEALQISEARLNDWKLDKASF